MATTDVSQAIMTLLDELVDGASRDGRAFVLNSGDVGFLRSLETLSASDASRSIDGGGTIAGHAQHVRYGLALMNRWATEGGDPFADAMWDAAWKTSAVDPAAWTEIRAGLREEAHQWRDAVRTVRTTSAVELTGMIASVADIAYHLGAIRQIAKGARGPRKGTFK